MKRRCSRLPCEWYDLGAVEHWLGDLAEKGWQLERINPVFAVFRKAPPQRCRYRLHPKQPGGREQEVYFSEMGWELVCTLKRTFCVFVSADAGTPELSTDPMVEAGACQKLCQEQRKRLLWLIAFPVLYVLLCMLFTWAVFCRGHHSLLAVSDFFAGGFEVCLALLLLFAAVMIGMVRHYRCLRRLCAQLALGEPVDHEAPYPDGSLLCRQYLWIGLSVAALLSVLLWINVSGRRQPTEGNAAVAAPLLSGLEQLDGRDWQKKDGWQDGYFEERTTLLSETFCKAEQAKHSGSLSDTLEVQSLYICARFPWTAELVFDSMKNRELKDVIFAGWFEPVQQLPGEPQFDQIVCYAWGNDRWAAVVRRGRQVLYAACSGQQTREGFLGLLEETLKRLEEAS